MPGERTARRCTRCPTPQLRQTGYSGYGPSGSFPQSTSASTNYWVDVLFVATKHAAADSDQYASADSDERANGHATADGDRNAAPDGDERAHDCPGVQHDGAGKY